MDKYKIGDKFKDTKNKDKVLTLDDVRKLDGKEYYILKEKETDEGQEWTLNELKTERFKKIK